MVIFATCLDVVITLDFLIFLPDSIGRDIPKMLELFKTGHEIKVDEERENFLKTKIATVSYSGNYSATFFLFCLCDSLIIYIYLPVL